MQQPPNERQKPPLQDARGADTAANSKRRPGKKSWDVVADYEKLLEAQTAHFNSSLKTKERLADAGGERDVCAVMQLDAIRMNSAVDVVEGGGEWADREGEAAGGAGVVHGQRRFTSSQQGRRRGVKNIPRTAPRCRAAQINRV